MGFLRQSLGWVGKLYLVDAGDGTYTKVWWNGMLEDPALSEPKALPACGSSDGEPDATADAGPEPDAVSYTHLRAHET